MLIGVALIGEGLDFHIPKGYIYFSIAFALVVDILQLRADRHKTPKKITGVDTAASKIDQV